MNRKRPVVMLVLLASLLAVSFTLAKGTPQKVTLSGPGLGSVIEVTDEATLSDLGMGMLEIFQDVTSEAPPGLGASYELTRYFYDDRHDTFIPFDIVRYYPRADGTPGYLFYVGIVGGWSEYDGRWIPVTRRGDAALREILSSHGVSLRAIMGARMRLRTALLAE